MLRNGVQSSTECAQLTTLVERLQTVRLLDLLQTLGTYVKYLLKSKPLTHVVSV